MPDSDNDDHHPAILDLCYHAIVADAVTPVASEFAGQGFSAITRIVQFGNLTQACGYPSGRDRTEFAECLLRFAA